MLGFKRRRRARLRARPFPAEWLDILARNVPFYECLPEADRDELRGHMQVFLAEKRFEGCGGLEITDEIRVTIAAQACVLLLHRKTDYYPGLRSILVYPRPYVVRNVRRMVDGILVEGQDVRLGESWHRGNIVLAWDSVQRGAADVRDGQNVVFHEFAHQLDSTAGQGDSTSVLASRSSFSAWARVLGRDFERFRQAAMRRRADVLHEYGATNPAEFFAVATESFFERPRDLQRAYPKLYQALVDFYEQDPAAW